MKKSLSAFVLLFTAFTLCQCSRPAEDTSALETELIEAKEKLSAARKRIGVLRDELGRAGSKTDDNQALINKSNVERQECEKALSAVKDEMLAHNKAYRESIRTRAAGMALEDFEALGRQFAKVVVKTVDDWELAFQHSSGMSRINLADAPPELRILFAYNPNIGPKPAPVVVAGVSSAPLPELLTAPESSAGSSTPSGDAHDPFYTHNRGAAAFAPPTRNYTSAAPTPRSTSANTLGNTVTREGRQQRKSRSISMSDGSAVEVIAGWGS